MKQNLNIIMQKLNTLMIKIELNKTVDISNYERSIERQV